MKTGKQKLRLLNNPGVQEILLDVLNEGEAGKVSQEFLQHVVRVLELRYKAQSALEKTKTPTTKYRQLDLVEFIENLKKEQENVENIQKEN